VSKQSSYMVFALGLVLLVLGLVLPSIAVEETRYRNIFGFQVPNTVTVYPYREIGGLLFIGGIISIAIGIYQSRSVLTREKEIDISTGMFYRYCGTKNEKDAAYCRKCGKKIS
jgi:uncharacterized membrane protein